MPKNTAADAKQPGGGLHIHAPGQACAYIQGLDAVQKAAGALRTDQTKKTGLIVTGAVNLDAAVCAAVGIAKAAGRPAVFVVQNAGNADAAKAVADAVDAGGRTLPVPTKTPAAKSNGTNTLWNGDRRGAIERVAAVAGLRKEPLEAGEMLVCETAAMALRVPDTNATEAALLRLVPGDDKGPGTVLAWLAHAGYERTDTAEEPGEFAVRGGVVDVFLAVPARDGAEAVRLDFFGDELESIREIDPETMAADRAIKQARIPARTPKDTRTEDAATLLPANSVAFIYEPAATPARGAFPNIDDAAKNAHACSKALRKHGVPVVEIGADLLGTDQDTVVDLAASNTETFPKDHAEAIKALRTLGDSRGVVVFCPTKADAERLGTLLQSNNEKNAQNTICAAVGWLGKGVLWENNTAWLPKGAVFGDAAAAPNTPSSGEQQTATTDGTPKYRQATDAFLDIQPGDVVVHTEHGVARFEGLVETKPPAQSGPETLHRTTVGTEERLVLRFAGGAALHVPAWQAQAVHKYIGGAKGTVRLSSIGQRRWNTQKERAANATKDLAEELLRTQAAREATSGIQYPRDTPWQHAFEKAFPYRDTDDQRSAIAEIKADMQADKPMDRLLCGDVGYGKTELAVRAAFKAAEAEKQTAVLAPTTVLVEQHERTFKQRFAGYPFRVESLSRFKTAAEQRETIDAAARGEVDVLIGTHRILSKDVSFRELGLVVVDEEQRFGVEHKHALTAMRAQADSLTMTATPIPRTLHLSLLGLRDISALTTPPSGRLAVATDVAPENDRVIRDAIKRELDRGGRVYYLHNRVKGIYKAAARIQAICPTGTRVAVGHGQMPPGELEPVILGFMRGKIDVLVCTTIIESGVDIPGADTIVIADADRFGLAELHQLRGRVGRRNKEGVCLLMTPKGRTVKELARKRLRSIQECSELGAGFRLAIRDMEIRGAGAILGAAQSGHIADVGYEMYRRLLARAVAELRHEQIDEPPTTIIEIGVYGALTAAYIPSQRRRVGAYRRLAAAGTKDAIERVEHDLLDAYGEMPAAAQRLVALAHLRAGAHARRVRAIRVQGEDAVLRCQDPDTVQDALKNAHGSVRTVAPRTPNEHWCVHFRPPGKHLEPLSILGVLRRRMPAI